MKTSDEKSERFQTSHQDQENQRFWKESNADQGGDEGGDNDDGVAEYMPTDNGREVTKDRRIFLRS